jgi:hypothetical protein
MRDTKRGQATLLKAACPFFLPETIVSFIAIPNQVF